MYTLILLNLLTIKGLYTLRKAYFQSISIVISWGLFHYKSILKRRHSFHERRKHEPVLEVDTVLWHNGAGSVCVLNQALLSEVHLADCLRLGEKRRWNKYLETQNPELFIVGSLKMQAFLLEERINKHKKSFTLPVYMRYIFIFFCCLYHSINKRRQWCCLFSKEILIQIKPEAANSSKQQTKGNKGSV